MVYLQRILKRQKSLGKKLNIWERAYFIYVVLIEIPSNVLYAKIIIYVRIS